MTPDAQPSPEAEAVLRRIYPPTCSPEDLGTLSEREHAEVRELEMGKNYLRMRLWFALQDLLCASQWAELLTAREGQFNALIADFQELDRMECPPNTQQVARRIHALFVTPVSGNGNRQALPPNPCISLSSHL